MASVKVLSSQKERGLGHRNNVATGHVTFELCDDSPPKYELNWISDHVFDKHGGVLVADCKSNKPSEVFAECVPATLKNVQQFPHSNSTLCSIDDETLKQLTPSLRNNFSAKASVPENINSTVFPSISLSSLAENHLSSNKTSQVLESQNSILNCTLADLLSESSISSVEDVRITNRKLEISSCSDSGDSGCVIDCTLAELLSGSSTPSFKDVGNSHRKLTGDLIHSVYGDDSSDVIDCSLEDLLSEISDSSMRVQKNSLKSLNCLKPSNSICPELCLYHSCEKSLSDTLVSKNSDNLFMRDETKSDGECDSGVCLDDLLSTVIDFQPNNHLKIVEPENGEKLMLTPDFDLKMCLKKSTDVTDDFDHKDSAVDLGIADIDYVNSAHNLSYKSDAIEILFNQKLPATDILKHPRTSLLSEAISCRPKLNKKRFQTVKSIRDQVLKNYFKPGFISFEEQAKPMLSPFVDRTNSCIL